MPNKNTTALYGYPLDHMSYFIVIISAITVIVMVTASVVGFKRSYNANYEESKKFVSRVARVSSLVSENMLTNSTSSLQEVKRNIENTYRDGVVSRQSLIQILRKSTQRSNSSSASKSSDFFYLLDSNNKLIADSSDFQSYDSEMLDQSIFQSLRLQPLQNGTSKPFLAEDKNGRKSLFISVPIRDKEGESTDLLIMQINLDDFYKSLDRYVEPPIYKYFLTQYDGNYSLFSSLSFSENSSEESKPNLDSSLKINLFTQDNSPDILLSKNEASDKELLIGYSRSTEFGLMTHVSLPIKAVRASFWKNNSFLLSIVISGLFFVLILFYYLYKLSLELSLAMDHAVRDPLTSLHNRRFLDAGFPLLLRDSRRTKQPISVLFIDIDFFRRFNERYGHESGDIALKAVAKCLSISCKRPMDLICRWGGEEFVAILPHTNQSAAEYIANDMLNSVRSIRLELPNASAQRITVSIGCVTAISSDDNALDDLVDIADRAMQQAKLKGRNQLVIFETTNIPSHAVNFAFGS